MNKNPICKTERLENIELSLEALREDGVEMPGILAQGRDSMKYFSQLSVAIVMH